MRSLLYPVAICSSVVVLAGCGLRDTDRAQSVAQQFVVAMNNNDNATVKSLLTAKAQEASGEALSGTDSQPKKESDRLDVSFGAATIEGDLATVATTSNDPKKPGTADILMRRENKEWRVYALRLSGDGKSLTMDFEHPERIVGEALGLALGSLATDAEKAGRALGQVMGGFAKGMEQGLKETAPSTPAPTREPSGFRQD